MPQTYNLGLPISHIKPCSSFSPPLRSSSLQDDDGVSTSDSVSSQLAVDPMAAKQLIVVYEGTMAMEPYWPTVFCNYVEKIIRSLPGNELCGQVCFFYLNLLFISSVCIIWFWKCRSPPPLPFRCLWSQSDSPAPNFLWDT